MISGENELFNENKNIIENFRNIQKKFDLLASNYEKLHSKIIIAEKMTSTLQDNLSLCNSSITELQVFTKYLRLIYEMG